MIPILYANVTEGTVPTSFGKGALSDVLSCPVKEDLNGAFELVMEYAAEGIHASDIVPNAIIKAKPNYTDDPQLFRIYKVGKKINGRFTVNAQHISYDLSGKVIASGSATNCVDACALLDASAGNFTINTDKSSNGAFSVSEPSSVRSWFGGKSGSLLDVFGGEWKYNNYVASLKQARGQDRGVNIRYGKNLVDLSQELSMENLVTGVVPYYKDSQTGTVTTGAKVSTGHILDVGRDIAVDFSEKVDPESQTSITAQLATLAARYISNHNLTNLVNSITLDFVQLQGLTERVDLGDTCHIYFEALGISASAKCVSTTWDVLEERYTSATFGSLRSSIADVIANTEKRAESNPSTSAMRAAINRATELITGNLGGYVIIHDSNGDCEPDEILVMDTADINTATKVWRWNKNGLGYSSNGYAGPYGLAMTADGEIVADFITTGTLNADLIKAGTIQDIAGNSTINMTNGEANLRNLIAKNLFRIVTDLNVVIASIEPATNGGLIAVGNNSAQQVGTLQAGADGGYIGLADNNGDLLAVLYAGANGGVLNLKSGNLTLKNANGNTVLQEYDGTNGGIVAVGNNSGQQVATLQAGADGGYIGIGNNSGDQTASFYSGTNGGVISLRNGSAQNVYLGAGSSGGEVTVKDGSGNNAVQNYTDTNGGIVRVLEPNGTSVAAMFVWQYGGYIYQKNMSGVQTVNLRADEDGGLINVSNNSGGLAMQMGVTSEGGGTFFTNDSNGNKTIRGIGQTGDLICVVLTQTSSRKLKENIKPIDDAWKILELNAVSFDFKNKNFGTDRRGFIAEDVEKILPNLVRPETENSPAALDYVGMIPYLQTVIKEQETRIKKLEDVINECLLHGND